MKETFFTALEFFTPLDQSLLDRLPKTFPSPFNNIPHELARLAGQDLQQRLEVRFTKQDGAESSHSANNDGGKMFGVLLVLHEGQLGYLSAFSGKLNKQWCVEGFAPALVQANQIESVLEAADSQVTRLTAEITAARVGLKSLIASQNTDPYLMQLRLDAALLSEKNTERKSARAIKRADLKKHTTSLDQQKSHAVLKQLAAQSQQDRVQIKALRQTIKNLEEEYAVKQRLLKTQVEQLTGKRVALSARAQSDLFELYQLRSFNGRQSSLAELLVGIPTPAGTGDCAAPKLFMLANKLHMQPIALAEFWWGKTSNSGVRHHARFYPSCRGKCGLILPFIVQGLNCEESKLANTENIHLPAPLYEDEHLAVLDKPAGLLSIPGKQIHDSVLARVQQWWPDADGPLLVHRLDMETSGLILCAKSLAVHKQLQRQFMSRSIKKSYEALLEGVVAQSGGSVNLPLRVDLNDRPRQRVCEEHGKSALTYWKVVGTKVNQQTGNVQSLIEFSPVTGRTHQLRVHAAHTLGLGMPIEGDSLYGTQSVATVHRSSQFAETGSQLNNRSDALTASDTTAYASTNTRMKLHAVRLEFVHPISQQVICVESPTPF